MDKKYKDLVIIGSGPAGLAAAVYGNRAMLDEIVLEREMIHRPGDSFHSVRAKGFCRIFIEYFNKVREKVYACDLSFGVLCQCDGLSAGTTADVGYL